MALDTAAKRKAVLGVARPWMRSQESDASVGRTWRACVANSYPVADFAVPITEGILRGCPSTVLETEVRSTELTSGTRSTELTAGIRTTEWECNP